MSLTYRQVAVTLALTAPVIAMHAQVVRPNRTAAASAIAAATPPGAPVTASLPSIRQIDIPMDKYLIVGPSASSVAAQGSPLNSFLYYEARDGQTVLVHDRKGSSDDDVYPPGSMVLYSGPYVTKIGYVPHIHFRIYVLRPVGSTATEHARLKLVSSRASVGSRAEVVMERTGGQQTSDERMTQWEPTSPRPTCFPTPPVDPGKGGLIAGFTCFKLQEGQLVRLAGGLILSRSKGALLLRSEQQVLEDLGPISSALVVRDSAQRVWILYSVGIA